MPPSSHSTAKTKSAVCVNRPPQHPMHKTMGVCTPIGIFTVQAKRYDLASTGSAGNLARPTACYRERTYPQITGRS